MGSQFPYIPEQASTVAASVDQLYLFLWLIGLFFSLLIFVVVFYFAVRYRRRSEDETTPDIHGSYALELTWSLIPLAISMVIFVWGAMIFFKNSRPPADALEVYVVGKQWMWKLQHPDGPREINNLHVPIGVPVKLIMTSEDVIHSLYIPAFRIKMDVLPGRYTSLWFQPTKVGQYHLFCAEYCGTKHAEMGGHVEVMERADYERWLSGSTAGESMPVAGEKLFDKLSCNTCHQADARGRGPVLNGLFGKKVDLASGASVIADEGYLRESILNPHAKVVGGYRPIMPTFQGQVSEEGVAQLIAYIKSLAKEVKKN